ncbi:uncharacterized protein EV154DRAFT_488854 [Mucor mucedo]|uniref:uncharacterized protein n=1 Tax=Mucor mucedo TaxID=29922 RepID=UPI00221F65B9|nr:uncharacterized protein EV154DRAFT_488854 [Mucor mucedo]KAI7864710.1 hypothetical protein EV154DRAFT_488854 [Mucor mucedo]
MKSMDPPALLFFPVFFLACFFSGIRCSPLAFQDPWTVSGQRQLMTIWRKYLINFYKYSTKACFYFFIYCIIAKLMVTVSTSHSLYTQLEYIFCMSKIRKKRTVPLLRLLRLATAESISFVVSVHIQSNLISQTVLS